MNKLYALALVGLVGFGCSSEGGDDGPAEVPRLLTVASPQFEVKAGQEITKCVDFRLPTEKASNIVKIKSTLAAGSHHLILYRSAESAEKPTPYTCSPFTGALNGTLPIYIAQTEGTTIELPQTPKRVALKLLAGQMVRLEMHYVNYDTTKSIMGSGSVELTTIDDLMVDEYAELMFWGSTQINVPPMQEATVGPTWHAPPPGTTLLALTAHTHKYGIDFRVERAEKDMPGTEIYATQDWDNPPFLQFTPELKLGPTEGLRWSCKYRNTTSRTIRFGESADQEMCFLWGFYYPSRGFLAFVDYQP
ncbi:MAG: hypothetical protein IT370_17100 [Deltaproteobacteria bacterium]|nr:hypothetical protein [Deltaproteobacteria bacterium]